MPTVSTSMTPNRNSAPLSPPARLHLRNILPASPEEPPIMPPPPRTPRPWVWQCHRCLTVYRLGCTRRCLECGHTYCVSSAAAKAASSSAAAASSSSRSSSSSLASSGNNDTTTATTNNNNNDTNNNDNPERPRSRSRSRSRSRRRRDVGLCGAEFDYVGWEQWGFWRRKVLGYEALGRSDLQARDKAFLGKKHDCWIDCDSPSECCHRRHELVIEAVRLAEIQAKEAQELIRKFLPVNDSRRGYGSDSASGSGTGGDGIMVTTEVREERGSANNGEEDEERPKSPLQLSSFLWEDEDEDMENAGVGAGGSRCGSGCGSRCGSACGSRSGCAENKENEEGLFDQMFEVEERYEAEQAKASSSMPEPKRPRRDPYAHWDDAMRDDSQGSSAAGASASSSSVCATGWAVGRFSDDDIAHDSSDSDSDSSSSGGWSSSSEEEGEEEMADVGF
ncbi:hypothetical protein F5Y08DRAFT_305785 [Xylaria arbuscula]|nr:hypothetical protein F5Y08DRAFT_305785 [Xylaria arbuscula]